MTMRFTAVVELGLLRPIEPVPFAEGERIDLIAIHPGNGHPPLDAAGVLAEIAAMPMEPGGQVFDGRDHDQILYGARGST